MGHSNHRYHLLALLSAHFTFPKLHINMKSSSIHELLKVLPQRAMGLLALAGWWQPDHMAVHGRASVLLSLEDF